jgi:hypothetical protein
VGPERGLKALHAFLREVGGRPFEWGVWDCLIFTNAAFRSMHGKGWADDWVGRYIDAGRLLTRMELRREYGHQTVEDALCERLLRAYDIPPRGALVVGGPEVIQPGYLGVGFGIAVGTSAAFLSASGVVYSPIESIDSAWVRHDDAA